jgi:hypothetical protein
MSRLDFINKKPEETDNANKKPSEKEIKAKVKEVLKRFYINKIIKKEKTKDDNDIEYFIEDREIRPRNAKNIPFSYGQLVEYIIACHTNIIQMIINGEQNILFRRRIPVLMEDDDD